MAPNTRGTGLSFSIRAWFTRRVAQRQLWKPAQHHVGLFGITKVGAKKLKLLVVLVQCGLAGLMLWDTRHFEERNCFTWLHVWMADLGLFRHDEILALKRIGQSQESHVVRTQTNANLYGHSVNNADGQGPGVTPGFTGADLHDPFGPGAMAFGQMPSVVRRGGATVET
eukprot:TRINITY_DN47391_c0_g1_i1.p2 TRINITY_DN47391_c0_g1~~TRINITY_DN47391_c0_g1_i1.p2  ORF type:complete len:169 (+),score=29.29 TRINITY_DN47391_c0_g1_i1:88-594(+)